MTIELGKAGIWRHPSGLTPEMAAEVEALGYGAIWLGGSPDGDLGVVDPLLDATDRIVVGTSIVNVWKDDAATVAASYHRIAARYPDRFLLGLGIGHPEATQQYQKPYDKLVSYLDELDDLKVPASGRALAALGPRRSCGCPPSGPRARSPTWSRRSTPGRPGRSSAPGRCSPPSRSWCSRPTPSGPGPSAGRACRTRTWA